MQCMSLGDQVDGENIKIFNWDTPAFVRNENHPFQGDKQEYAPMEFLVLYHIAVPFNTMINNSPSQGLPITLPVWGITQWHIVGTLL